MTPQPTPAALRAATHIANCSPEIFGGLEFELATVIDTELSQEREQARELERALESMLEEYGCETYFPTGEERLDGKFAIALARAVLAKLRADREGSQ